MNVAALRKLAISTIGADLVAIHDTLSCQRRHGLCHHGMGEPQAAIAACGSIPHTPLDRRATWRARPLGPPPAAHLQPGACPSMAAMGLRRSAIPLMRAIPHGPRLADSSPPSRKRCCRTQSSLWGIGPTDPCPSRCHLPIARDPSAKPQTTRNLEITYRREHSCRNIA